MSAGTRRCRSLALGAASRAGARRARPDLAGAAEPGAREARGQRALSRVPRSRRRGLGLQVPRVPRAAAQAQRGRHGAARPPRLSRLPSLPRRAPGRRVRARVLGQAGAGGLRPRAHRPRPGGEAQAQLACSECHKTRSFLGAVSDCSSCHRDEHRGQFAGRACTSCHDEQAWKPAPGFDHAKTAWPLSGRHAAVACERCHAPRQPDPKDASVQLPRVPGGERARVRELPRGRAQGRASARGCASCHTSAGWKQVKAAQRRPRPHRLPARPGGTAASPATRATSRGFRCGSSTSAAATAMRTCTPDTLAARAEPSRCESCHTLDGFRPARFGPDEHAKTAYPLRGAHLAVACDECHKRAATAAGGAGASTATSPRVPLKLPAARCVDCHRDPHRGETAAASAQNGCETCHRVESWRQVAFDHAQHPLSAERPARRRRLRALSRAHGGSRDADRLQGRGRGVRRLPPRPARGAVRRGERPHRV